MSGEGNRPERPGEGHGTIGSREFGTTPADDARLRRVVDAAPFGAHVYELASDGRLIFVAGNESADRILGLECSRFVGMTMEEAFPPLAETRLPAAYREVARTGVRFHEEQVVYDADGITGVFDVYGIQLAPGQMAAFFQDITERRKAEAERARLEARLQQAQKMEAIGALAGGIAHDFNNILTAIIGYAELLRLTLEPDDPRIEDVDQIRKASDSAVSLIRQLLAFTRREATKREPVDLGDSVRNCEKLLRRVLGEHIELVIEVADDEDPVLADETEIVQVILNLAVNARDAMPAGGTLRIGVLGREVDEAFAVANPPLRPGSYVALAVRDDGVGMDEETRRRAFEPFFTTKEAGRGTGLGLATVYAIVERSNGAVFVESEERRGSTFTIYLPRMDGGSDPVDAETHAHPSTRVKGSILLVEDADEVRTYATRVLEARGHRVVAARDGAAALEIVSSRNQRFDILLSDVVMPQISGVELAERIRVRVPGIRVVFMSGYPDTAFAGRDVVPGFHLIPKPFDPDELASVIAEVLTEP